MDTSSGFSAGGKQVAPIKASIVLSLNRAFTMTLASAVAAFGVGRQLLATSASGTISPMLSSISLSEGTDASRPFFGEVDASAETRCELQPVSISAKKGAAFSAMARDMSSLKGLSPSAFSSLIPCCSDTIVKLVRIFRSFVMAFSFQEVAGFLSIEHHIWVFRFVFVNKTVAEL